MEIAKKIRNQIARRQNLAALKAATANAAEAQAAGITADDLLNDVPAAWTAAVDAVPRLAEAGWKIPRAQIERLFLGPASDLEHPERLAALVRMRRADPTAVTIADLARPDFRSAVAGWAAGHVNSGCAEAHFTALAKRVRRAFDAEGVGPTPGEIEIARAHRL